MLNKQKDTFQKAKEYCFLLLKFRLRSEEEIRRKLKKNGFDNSIVEDTIAYLKERGFIDDREFTKSWLESRLRSHLGLKRIRQELIQKGIDRKIIDEEIELLKEDYSEEDLVKRLSQKKLAQLKGLDPQKVKRRLYGYLLRRGFSTEVVTEIINQLI